MNRAILFVVFAFLLSLESYCQFSIPIQPWAKNIENRILIVELWDENPKQIKKLSKEGSQAVADYKNRIAERNASLRGLIPNYWPFGNKIEFKKTSEVNEIVKNKDERYLILNYRYTKEIRQSVKVYYTFAAYAILVYYPEYGKRLTQSYYVDNNQTSEYFKRGQYVFKVSLPESFLNERDMKFAMYQFKEFIERAKTEGWPSMRYSKVFKSLEFDSKNALKLKEKILLFPRELLKIDENQIKDEYKASYKILPLAEIDSLLENDVNNEYAYYNVIWSDKRRFWTLLIIDNSTGNILAEIPSVDKQFQFRVAVPSVGSSMATIFKTADVNFIINAQHLEILAKLLNQ